MDSTAYDRYYYRFDLITKSTYIILTSGSTACDTRNMVVSQTAAAVLGASPLVLSTNNATNLGRKSTIHRLMQGVNVGFCDEWNVSVV